MSRRKIGCELELIAKKIPSGMHGTLFKIRQSIATILAQTEGKDVPGSPSLKKIIKITTDRLINMFREDENHLAFVSPEKMDIFIKQANSYLQQISCHEKYKHLRGFYITKELDGSQLEIVSPPFADLNDLKKAMSQILEIIHTLAKEAGVHFSHNPAPDYPDDQRSTSTGPKAGHYNRVANMLEKNRLRDMTMIGAIHISFSYSDRSDAIQIASQINSRIQQLIETGDRGEIYRVLGLSKARRERYAKVTQINRPKEGTYNEATPYLINRGQLDDYQINDLLQDDEDGQTAMKKQGYPLIRIKCIKDDNGEDLYILELRCFDASPATDAVYRMLDRGETLVNNNLPAAA